MSISAEKTVQWRVREQICNALENQEPDRLQPTDRIIHDLGADSLDVTEIIVYCEQEFDIDLQDDEIGPYTTVQDIINLVQSKL